MTSPPRGGRDESLESGRSGGKFWRPKLSLSNVENSCTRKKRYRGRGGHGRMARERGMNISLDAEAK